MTTNFPSGLDSFTNPTATDAMDSVTVPHADQHADVNDAVEALQAKVGVDGSAVTSSLDYKVANQGLTLVKSQTISSGAGSVTVTDAFPSTFREFQIVGDIVCQTNNTTVLMQLSGITGSDYDGSVYYNTFGSGAVESVAGFNNATSWDIGHWRYGGSMFLQNVNIGSYKMYNFGIVSDVTYMRRGGGRCQSTTSATGFTLTPATGLFSSGTIRIFGYNKG